MCMYRRSGDGGDDERQADAREDNGADHRSIMYISGYKRNRARPISIYIYICMYVCTADPAIAVTISDKPTPVKTTAPIIAVGTDV